MVNFKSLFVGASLLVSGVFAAPFSDVAAPEARSLDRRTLTGGARDPNNILENTYIAGPNYQKQGLTSATVSDLSGCTALWIWTKNFEYASVFHIFCGQESADGEAAGWMVEELGKKWYEGGAGIFASSQDRANKVAAGLREAIPDIQIINTEIYTPGTGEMARTRVTVAARSNTFNEVNYQGTPTQPGKKI